MPVLCLRKILVLLFPRIPLLPLAPLSSGGAYSVSLIPTRDKGSSWEERQVGSGYEPSETVCRILCSGLLFWEEVIQFHQISPKSCDPKRHGVTLYRGRHPSMCWLLICSELLHVQHSESCLMDGEHSVNVGCITTYLGDVITP